jgi:hypothetical protein
LKDATRIGAGTETVLTGSSLNDVNSFTEPKKVAPNTRAFKPGRPVFHHTFPANSLTVLRMKARS